MFKWCGHNFAPTQSGLLLPQAAAPQPAAVPPASINSWPGSISIAGKPVAIVGSWSGPQASLALGPLDRYDMRPASVLRRELASVIDFTECRKDWIACPWVMN